MPVIGFENTTYQVSEDEGVVELCVVVYSPVIECPIDFGLIFNLHIEDGSAGIYFKSMYLFIQCISKIT